jgi:hypothetical protein
VDGTVDEMIELEMTLELDRSNERTESTLCCGCRECGVGNKQDVIVVVRTNQIQR